MITLSDDLLIGKGLHRKCFQHPNESGLCIKIMYNLYKKGGAELKRELAYYSFLKKYLKDWRGIPYYHGEVETNLGVGYVYDRVVDFDGRPSESMMVRYSKEGVNIAEVYLLLDELKNYLHDNRIVTMALKPYNILVRRLDENQVFPVICDNIGTASFIPVEKYIPWFCCKKQERQFKRFLNLDFMKKLMQKK